MSSLTPRLGLILPSDPEPQDITTLDTNFTMLDASVGIILVNDGVTPPNSQLYDGAIVKEKTSGLVWVAQKNVGTGNYDKSIIVQPFKPYTEWVACSTTWAASYVGVPGFSYRRFNGWVEFSGTMYFAGAMPATQVVLDSTNVLIKNAVAPNSTDTVRQNVGFTCAAGWVQGGLVARPVGQLVLFSPGGTGVVLCLDGIKIRDVSVV